MSESSRVEPAFPGDFDEVFGLLKQLDPHRPAAEWRRIFDYRWRRPDEPVGYLLRNGNEVVGYVGMILSEMTVDGRLERFCNVTSWVTRPEHRGEGALLVLQLNRLKGYTITNLTSNPATLPVFRRLGFEPLETVWTVLRPTPAVMWRRSRCRVRTDPAEIRPLLEATHQRILDDHLALTHHLLVSTDRALCYAVYTIRQRWRLRAVRLHYISNPELLAEHWPAVHRRLFLSHGAPLAEADSRLLSATRIPGAVRKEMSLPRLFRSPHLRPEQVTDLYSEMILLPHL